MSWSRIARRTRVPLGFVLAVLYWWLAHPTAWSIVAGAALAAAGLCIRAYASGHVRKNENLATTGPYALTRNPLYLGSVVIAGGFAVAARSWPVVVLLALMFLAVYLPVIRGEEAYLRERFPEFAEYERRVPRLIPRVRELFSRSRDSSGEFSRDLYLQHREYQAAAGTLAMIVSLCLKFLGKR